MGEALRLEKYIYQNRGPWLDTPDPGPIRIGDGQATYWLSYIPLTGELYYTLVSRSGNMSLILLFTYDQTVLSFCDRGKLDLYHCVCYTLYELFSEYV